MAIALTKASSIQDRIGNARFMKSINAFYLKALHKDLDGLEQVEPDLAYALRGVLLAYQNDLDSISYWEKAIELNPSAEHYYNFGMSYLILGQPRHALEMFRKTLELGENNLGLLELLKTPFSNFYAYKECEKIVYLLNKMKKTEESFPEKNILVSFFQNNTEIMLKFGEGVSEIISRYIPHRFIYRTKESQFEERRYSRYIVKCFDDSDVQNVVDCNQALADFITDFEEEHQLNLGNLFICCEASE